MDIKIKFIFLLLIMGVVTTSGCISSGEGNNATITPVNATVDHYDGSQASFDIPRNWTMYTFLEPWATFAIRNFTPDEISFFMMFSLEGDDNMTAQEVLMQTMSSPGQTIISQRNLTVDNASAYQIVASDSGSSDTEYVIQTVVIKNNRVYLIIVATNSAYLNQTQNDLDFILNSTILKG